MNGQVNKRACLKALTLLFLLCLSWSCRLYPEQGKWHRGDFTLMVDPNFSSEHLPSDIQDWYERFRAGIISEHQIPDSGEYAQSNDTFKYGRMLNSYITHLLTVLRVTGDQKILYEVARLSDLMKGQLRDWSISKLGSKPAPDGYLNWQYFYDPIYVESDAMVMDEMLSHSLVAAMAYAFHVNRDLDPRFAASADFWVDYLKNHFEAKWRDRNEKPEGVFLDKDLAHPYAHWIRFNHYMSLLTGESFYLQESRRRADVMMQHLLPTDSGALVWDHRMTGMGLNRSWGCQPFVYSRQTLEALLDLHLESLGNFNEQLMSRLTVTIREHILDNGSINFAPDICGGKPMAGLKRSSYERESPKRYATSGYTMYSAWDSTGKIKALSEGVYFKLETDPSAPQRVFIPAGIVFSGLYGFSGTKR